MGLNKLTMDIQCLGWIGCHERRSIFDDDAIDSLRKAKLGDICGREEGHVQGYITVASHKYLDGYSMWRER